VLFIGMDRELRLLGTQRLCRDVLELKVAAGEPVVVIVTAALAGLPWLGFGEEDEIVHRAPGGSPPQENVTGWLTPFCAVNVIENVAAPPAAMVILPGDPLNEKPWLPPGEVTVTVVDPQLVPAQAVTAAVPAATANTTPLLVESLPVLLLAESLVMVATVESEELQITDASVCLLLSL